MDGQTDRLRVSISRDDKAMIHMTGYESGINLANIIIVVSGLDTHNAHSDQIRVVGGRRSFGWE